MTAPQSTAQQPAGRHPAAPLATLQPDVASVAAAVKAGRASAVYAAPEAMGGDGRPRLLAWMCATDPAQADPGSAELSALSAAVAEGRRVRHNRRSTLRSRARRRAARQAAA